MNTPLSTTPGANSAQTTTTEELIVQYLDGELVRKELETVLFDRLASSEEARTLLREYLVVRGAIRQSHKDERFQLSNQLDARTRSRIEQLFETIAVEGYDVAFPVSAPMTGDHFLGDRAAVATNPATRRLKQRIVRSSLAFVALLLAVGTTWFVTRTSDEHGTIRQLAQQLPATTQPQVQPATVTSETVSTSATMAPKTPRDLSRGERPTAKPIAASPSFAQTHASQAVQPKAVAPTQTDPADVMMSDRFGKAIEAAGKHEVVISHQDRL